MKASNILNVGDSYYTTLSMHRAASRMENVMCQEVFLPASNVELPSPIFNREVLRHPVFSFPPGVQHLGVHYGDTQLWTSTTEHGQSPVGRRQGGGGVYSQVQRGLPMSPTGQSPGRAEAQGATPREAAVGCAGPRSGWPQGASIFQGEGGEGVGLGTPSPRATGPRLS